MRRTPLVATGLVVVLCILSFVFVFLTLKSPAWASQSYFYAENRVTDGLNQSHHLFVVHRSPFYRCGVPIVYDNGSWSLPDCHWYKPYGNMSTSCRSPTELGIARNDPVAAKGLFGSAQECQQVHTAGNLQIAACVFITLGLLLAFVVAAIPFTKRSSPTPSQTEKERSHYKGHVLLALLLLCLYAGAILQIGAQFFGVLGLTVNATPSADDANSFQTVDELANFGAHAWVMDRGLLAYATVTWTMALGAAFITNAVFRTLRFS